MTTLTRSIIVGNHQSCLLTLPQVSFVLFSLLVFVPLPCLAGEYGTISEFRPKFSQRAWQEIVSADEKAKVFNLIYESCQSNLNKIVSWEAQYELGTFSNPTQKTSSQRVSEVYKDMTKGIVDFAINFPEDRLNWKYTCISTNTSDEVFTDIPGAIPSSQIDNINDSLSFHAIYLPNFVYIRRSLKPVTGQLQSIPDYALSEQNVVFRLALEDQLPSNYSQRSDPRYFFSPARGGDGKWSPYWGSFAGISSILLGKNGEETKQRINAFFKLFQCDTSGGDVLYKISVMNEKNEPFDEEIYSSVYGFNLINKTQFASLDEPDIAFTWTYKEANGVYIPSRYTIFHSPGGSIICYKLLYEKLNLNLSKDVFSMQALGIKDGDVLLDFPEKTNYIFQKGKPVKLCVFNEKPNQDVLNANIHSKSSRARIVLMVAGTSLIILGLYMKVKKHRQERSARNP